MSGIEVKIGNTLYCKRYFKCVILSTRLAIILIFFYFLLPWNHIKKDKTIAIDNGQMHCTVDKEHQHQNGRRTEEEPQEAASVCSADYCKRWEEMKDCLAVSIMSIKLWHVSLRRKIIISFCKIAFAKCTMLCMCVCNCNKLSLYNERQQHI